MTASRLLDLPVWLINLDSRPDRLASVQPRLANAGFTDVRRLAATSWETVTVDEAADFRDRCRAAGRKGGYPMRRLRATLATVRSHRRAAETIAESGRSGWIAEDDAIFTDAWEPLAARTLNTLVATHRPWQACHFGPTHLRPPAPAGPYLHRVRGGAHSLTLVLWTADGAARYADLAAAENGPADEVWDPIIDDGTMLAPRGRLVWQADGHSDVLDRHRDLSELA